MLIQYGNPIINLNYNKIYLIQLVPLSMIIDNKIIFLVQLTTKIISNKSNLKIYLILLQPILIHSIYSLILDKINYNQIFSTKMFLIIITNLNQNTIIINQKNKIFLGCNKHRIYFNKTNPNYKFKFLINNHLIQIMMLSNLIIINLLIQYFLNHNNYNYNK